MKDNIYYVYIVKYKGEIVYIGKGKHHRYEHVNSGCSHIYEANRLHHNEGVVFDVTIIHKNSTDESAAAKEKELILKHLPRWNSRGKGNYENVTALLMVRIKELIVSSPDYPAKITPMREKKLKVVCAIIREIMTGITSRPEILVRIPEAYSLLHNARSTANSSIIDSQKYLYKYISISKSNGNVTVVLSDEGEELVERAKTLCKCA